MSNHVHLLMTPQAPDAAGRMMKALGERYVQYINQTYTRTGTLWEGRFKSCLVEDETYLLICHRYIELNPVRAGMVSHPSLYRWSSHRCNGYGERDEIITPHALFTSLGNDQSERLHAYRGLFDGAMNEEDIASVRDATNYNYAFGSPAFAEQLAQSMGCQVARIARPRKHYRP